MTKIKFIKPTNFKPPCTDPMYKIYQYNENNYYYVARQKGPTYNRYLSTSGNFISSHGYNLKSWEGWFKTKKQAKTLLESLGVTYE